LIKAIGDPALLVVVQFCTPTVGHSGNCSRPSGSGTSSMRAGAAFINSQTAGRLHVITAAHCMLSYERSRDGRTPLNFAHDQPCAGDPGSADAGSYQLREAARCVVFLHAAGLLGLGECPGRMSGGDLRYTFKAVIASRYHSELIQNWARTTDDAPSFVRPATISWLLQARNGESDGKCLPVMWAANRREACPVSKTSSISCHIPKLELPGAHTKS